MAQTVRLYQIRFQAILRLNLRRKVRVKFSCSIIVVIILNAFFYIRNLFSKTMFLVSKHSRLKLSVQGGFGATRKRLNKSRLSAFFTFISCVYFQVCWVVTLFQIRQSVLRIDFEHVFRQSMAPGVTAKVNRSIRR